MYIRLWKSLLKFKIILGTFLHDIKHTFTDWFFNGAQYRCAIINLTDTVIRHLFSSKFLSSINNAIIDDLEHKSYKAVFNTMLFYVYEKILPPIPTFCSFCSVFSNLFFPLFFFFIKNILHHDDEIYYPFGSFVKFILAL